MRLRVRFLADPCATATMFSLARSRYTLPTQFAFLAVNALGVLFSTIYNAKTPDLYPNNAHHKLGWAVTWIVSAQVLVGLVGRLAGAFSKKIDSALNTAERQGFLPVSRAAMDEHHRLHGSPYSALHRHSDDSGHGTESRPESLRSASFSSTPETLASPGAQTAHKTFHEEDDDLEADADLPTVQRDGAIRNFATKIGSKISSRAWRVLILGYNVVDRTSMILGFVALCTGVIVYGRFFEGNMIFTGLAHWIKGGIFFWLGIFTLGRWCGSFGELGWVSPQPYCCNRQTAPIFCVAMETDAAVRGTGLERETKVCQRQMDAIRRVRRERSHLHLRHNQHLPGAPGRLGW